MTERGFDKALNLAINVYGMGGVAQLERDRHIAELMKSRPGGLIRRKRQRVESLSNEEVDSLWSETETIYDFAKAIEKVYGIGVLDEYIAPVEKMQGIGGGE